MDGGAWWAAVHGVAKSQTWLSDFTFTFPFHALEKEIATHSSVLAWRIPGTGEPGGLPSMGLHRVRHDWSDAAAAAARSIWGFPDCSNGKDPPVNAGDQVQSLGQEIGLKKEMATHSSILAWRILWTEEPGRLQSMGSQRVGHNWATNFQWRQNTEYIQEVTIVWIALSLIKTKWHFLKKFQYLGTNVFTYIKIRFGILIAFPFHHDLVCDLWRGNNNNILYMLFKRLICVHLKFIELLTYK